MNIYVAGFPRETTEEELQEAFTAFGNVETVRVIKDKFTGESRGFAFVEMPSKTEAEAAINGLKDIKGRSVTINEARPREDRRGGFGGGGGGGRHGGGGSRHRDRNNQRSGGWR